MPQQVPHFGWGIHPTYYARQRSGDLNGTTIKKEEGHVFFSEGFDVAENVCSREKDIEVVEVEGIFSTDPEENAAMKFEPRDDATLEFGLVYHRKPEQPADPYARWRRQKQR